MTDNPDGHALSIKVVPVGESNEPIIIIDDFLQETAEILSDAQSSHFAPPVKSGGYPGIQSAMPRYYAQQILRICDPIIKQHLVQPSAVLKSFSCNLSLVTLLPSQLQPQQKIPHIDRAGSHRIAILHYLCDENFGGTAFFRQEKTGLEQVDVKDRQTYANAQRANMAVLDDRHGYPNGKTSGYSQTATFEARFNRVLIYRSMSLHSGIINRPERLSADPKKGRLTGNFFLDYLIL